MSNIEIIDGLFQKQISKNNFERMATDLLHREFVPFFNPHDEYRNIESIAIESLWYRSDINSYLTRVSKEIKKSYVLSPDPKIDSLPGLIYHPQRQDDDFGKMVETPYSYHPLIHSDKMNVFIWMDKAVYEKYLESRD
jgi:hypothetical protein